MNVCGEPLNTMGNVIRMSDVKLRPRKPEPKGAAWSITMPGCGQAKYILLTVWTGGNNYLNITRIAAFKKAASQSGQIRQIETVERIDVLAKG